MEDNDWKLLKIIEISMKNHEWVPIQDLRRKTGFHEKEVVFRLGRLNKFKFTNKSNYGYRLSHWGYYKKGINCRNWWKSWRWKRRRRLPRNAHESP